MSWLDLPRPILALAPMADMTDSPFCRVCREVAGSDFVIFREMVSAEAVVRGNEKTLKMCEFDEIEKPIVLQLFGSKPEVVVKAAEILISRGLLRTRQLAGPRNDIAGIDINMGCPVPKIVKNGLAGAGLMKDHERACGIVKALKRADLGLPISVKTRLGWSKKDEILEFAPKLEQAGADAIIIHGRTKIQGYGGSADWDMIGRAKQKVKIPVIANGDIKNAEDIRHCLQVTGCDGVMIGRAALGNPWVFRNFQFSIFNFQKISNYQLPITIDEVKSVVLRHAQLHLEHYGIEFGLKTFRKHLLCYFKNTMNAKEIRRELARVETMDDLRIILSRVKPRSIAI